MDTAGVYQCTSRGRLVSIKFRPAVQSKLSSKMCDAQHRLKGALKISLT